jgi:hypothetical protein
MFERNQLTVDQFTPSRRKFMHMANVEYLGQAIVGIKGNPIPI